MKVFKRSGSALSFLCLAVLFAANIPNAAGQATAAITGRIQDASGAAVPGATVTLTNQETGAARTVTSDATGTYRALSLAVGPYEVRAELSGFKTAVQTGIHLAVAQQAVVNLSLEVGTVAEQVTVTGEAPLINTTTASMAGLVGEREVKDLPLNGRSFDLLITLNPGSLNYSALKTDASSGAGSGNYFSVAGRRPMENMFLWNGVEFTGSSIVGITPGGVSGQLLGIDAVREFNVLSSYYSAEYGKRAGAQVSVVTQSGTNRFHGSVFEFVRNSALDARNFFDKEEVAPFKRNQFGGSAGGPIRKDSTFVFGSYEGFRHRLGLSSAPVVPDANARQGLLPCTASGTLACPAGVSLGTPIPVPGLDPRMLPFMSMWSEPNGENLGRGFAVHNSNPAQKIREEFGTVRVDQNFSASDTLAVSYTADDGDSVTPQADPLFVGNITLRSQVLSVQETHIFSPSVINTFSIGMAHSGFTYSSPPADPSQFPASLSFVEGRPPGSIVIGASSTTNAAAITPTGAANNPFNYFYRTLFNYQDQLQIVRGIHQLSVGAWFQRIRQNNYSPARSWGQAQFASLETLLQGMVGTFTVAPTGVPLGWRAWLGAWYVQDSIKLRPNLTVDIGIRHEFTNGWNEVHGTGPNFVFGPGGVLETQPRVADSPFTENNAKALFGPRLGIAWDPFGNGKTSVRAGAGIYYNLFDSSIYLLNSTPPFNGNASFSNAKILDLIPFRQGTPTAPACDVGVPSPCITYSPSGFQENFETPTVNSWTITVEQQLTNSMALRVGYVGSFATHQFVNKDSNSIHPVVCDDPAGCVSGGNIAAASRGRVAQGQEYIPVTTRPNRFLSSAIMYHSEGNASYHALQLDLERRFSNGLQFRTNYTWAKNLDHGSALASSQNQNGPGQIMSPYNLRADWGPASHDVQHSASANASYELPMGRGKQFLGNVSGVAGALLSGWQANGIVSLQAGFTVTPLVGSNRSGDANVRSTDRPNANPAFSGDRIVGDVNRWFDPNAFVLQTAGTYGNAGKGILKGPGLASVDFSLFKNTRLTERMELQFRSEFFNMFNRTNLNFPSPVVFSGSDYSPAAGRISKTATTSRQIQFGMKLIF